MPSQRSTAGSYPAERASDVSLMRCRISPRRSPRLIARALSTPRASDTWSAISRIGVPQLLHRTQHRKNQSMFRTIARAFAVDSLRAGDHDFLNRQVFLADDLEYLGRAERIYMHKFRNLWHVTAVGSLVKNDVCLV